MTVLDDRGVLAALDRELTAAAPHHRTSGRVLFDLDGLLVDTEPLGQMAERVVMDRLGSAITAEETAELLGCSMQRTVEILLARAKRPVPPGEVEALLDEAMLELVRLHGVRLLPGARELLAGVRACGLPHALVTSTGLVVADAILESAGLRFRFVVTGDDVKAAKPAPEPFKTAAALLGAKPADCTALEDSRHGVASAEAAGCQVIAVPSEGVEISLAPGRMVVSSLLELRATPFGVVLAC
jgi:HAD superfamily hydrolase (TIGR01509 family)